MGMNRIPLNTQIEHMDILTAKQIQKQIARRITSIRAKDTTKISTFISAEKKNAMLLTVDWLYSHGFLKRKTVYAFLKFAVENTIKLVLDQRESEEALQLQKSVLESQGEPNLNNANPAQNQYR